jgi:hypothetical protein
MLPDAVAQASGLAVQEAVAALIRLELRGLVRGTGGRFERAFVGRTAEDRTAGGTGGG